ncbi:hypothetical protein GGI04_000049 [Coemansia thaxteri]|uniref:Uncharacterized protein n=1 Tax=Coemansia thaxteri TaxID=2663907 RepID=A0A9W8BFQ7_9FUNG|nr:hypothetical protein H4R26_000952 [Coemansia thaxteri]KAJ2009950.1 hypothetical protein GGI04_000049 [Coemansia thaxteri]KAJ2473514.1 hypothetical protein GGI02_000801 [Coemansia sp. RSA 2322]KAJ2477461.1 hypothetical protein EV174_004613 [Coemansia sp. RSA 2320]
MLLRSATRLALARRTLAVPPICAHGPATQLQQQQKSAVLHCVPLLGRSIFTSRRVGWTNRAEWLTPVALVSSVAVAATLAFVGYGMFFGPGSLYPAPVRKLLREGGMSYMRPADKQDLPKAVECYSQALDLLDQLGASDPKHAPDAPHVTGLVARIAAVYTAMGDLDGAIRAYTDLLRRILGDAGMSDARTQVAQLLDRDLPADKRQNILRALGSANMLAEAHEARAARSKRRSILLADPDVEAGDVKEASRWYQWCLQVVMLTYQNHFNHLQLEKGQPLVNTPSFDPSTLPGYFSLEVVSSLFYNAATFFAGHGQFEYAVPLLQRGLDLLRRGTDGKEAGVCRSSVLMSHLANAAVLTGDLPAAERWAIEGLALAKQFPANTDCRCSYAALAYNLGAVYEAAGKNESARVQYRQTIEVARAIDDAGAEALATTALDRLAR